LKPTWKIFQAALFTLLNAISIYIKLKSSETNWDLGFYIISFLLFSGQELLWTIWKLYNEETWDVYLCITLSIITLDNYGLNGDDDTIFSKVTIVR